MERTSRLIRSATGKCGQRSQLLEPDLLVEREGIVDGRADAPALPELLGQPVAGDRAIRRHPQGELMPNVGPARKFLRQDQAGDILERLPVEAGIGSPFFVRLLQLGQLGQADRRFDVGHTEVEAQHLVVVALLGAMVADHVAGVGQCSRHPG